MKVYVVMEWNGESWEDSEDWIDKIFEDKKQAKEYIKMKNNKEEKRELEGWDYRHQWSLEEHKLIK